MALLDVKGAREMWEALKTARCSRCGQPFSTLRQKIQAVETVTAMSKGKVLERPVVTYRHKVCPKD